MYNKNLIYDEIRLYDITKLLTNPNFDQLANFTFLKQVKVDANGYGIYWNDDLDLAESELFDNSILIGYQDSKRPFNLIEIPSNKFNQ